MDTAPVYTLSHPSRLSIGSKVSQSLFFFVDFGGKILTCALQSLQRMVYTMKPQKTGVLTLNSTQRVRTALPCDLIHPDSDLGGVNMWASA